MESKLESGCSLEFIQKKDSDTSMGAENNCGFDQNQGEDHANYTRDLYLRSKKYFFDDGEFLVDYTSRFYRDHTHTALKLRRLRRWYAI